MTKAENAKIEEKIVTWVVFPWEQKMRREDLLGTRIRQIESKREDMIN